MGMKSFFPYMVERDKGYYCKSACVIGIYDGKNKICHEFNMKDNIGSLGKILLSFQASVKYL
jgi:hypothetical protein